FGSSSHCAPRDRPSFPTRRSSDLALVDKYVESDLVAMGERVASRPDVFPAGANLSVLLPLEPAEIFVRTFERGAGLTASCGSGRSEEHTSELQSRSDLVCRLLLEK